MSSTVTPSQNAKKLPYSSVSESFTYGYMDPNKGTGTFENSSPFIYAVIIESRDEGETWVFRSAYLSLRSAQLECKRIVDYVRKQPNASQYRFEAIPVLFSLVANEVFSESDDK